MQIGILSKVYTRPTLEGVLDAIAAAGLECIQFNFESAGLLPMPDEIPDGLAKRIRNAAANSGLAIASVQGTFNMSHPDPEHRRSGLRRLQLMASVCEDLGTSRIAICIGTRDQENMWRYNAENGSPEAWCDMLSCVREAVDIAQHTNVILAFEPEVTNVVDSAKKARRLLDEISSPYLKVTMDAANLFHAGDLNRMAEVLNEAFALVGKDVVLAHAKDLSHDGDAGHEAAGHGRLDYNRYLSLLDEYGFSGPLLLHGLGESQVTDCVAFLRSKLAEL